MKATPRLSSPRTACAACLLATASVAAQAQTVEAYRYQLRLEPGFRGMHADLCFAGTPPSRLVASARDAHRYLVNPRLVRDGSHSRLSAGSRGIELGNVQSDSCVRYSVDLAAAIRRGGRMARRAGDDLTTSPGLWLWQPHELPPDTELEVSFELPPGLAVSAPWDLVRRDAQQAIYRVGRTPYYWPATVAFGRFEVREIPVPGARLRLAVLDGEPPADAEAIAAWIREAAGAVATLYGAFPLPSPQILVLPNGRGREPVPWAQVIRGGGAAAHFYIDQRRPLEEFRADWTAAHELSHMLLPYLDRADAWLSEGFASYYQNVLRARAGLLTPREAWGKLHAGFERGVRDTRGDTLRETSRNMYRERAFMRVYWSGAAFALIADVHLRETSGGRQSLDTALAELRRCCLPADRMWTGDEFLARLDEITGTRIFSELANDYLDARTFPDLAPTYRRLGLRFPDAKLELEDASLAEVRDAIMRKAP